MRSRTNTKLRPKRMVALLLILSFLIAVIPTLPLTAETADTDEITIVREETDRRTANERHYLCSDGSIMAVAFSGDVHYMASDGTYQTIDNTLVYNEAKGQYRSTGNPNFAVTFAANASSPAVLLNDGKGNLLASATTVNVQLVSSASAQLITKEPASLMVRNETKVSAIGKSKLSSDVLKVPEVHSEIAYQNAYGSGITAEYAVDGNSLKENVIFSGPVSYTAIETRYQMDGLTVAVTEDGGLLLYNGEAEVAYTVKAPYMYDAAGAVCPAIAVSAVKEGDSWVVTYLPDAAWRNSAERVYPVVFDPLTSSATNSNIDDSYNVLIDGTFSENMVNEQLQVGYYLSDGDFVVGCRTFIKPTAYPTVPEGNLVQSVALTFVTSSVVGSGNLALHPITGSANFENNDYTVGNWLGLSSYSSSGTVCSFSLPAESYENCGDGYVIMDNSETITGGSHYVIFHSSRATSSANRPKIVVTYIPDHVANNITTLYNSATGQFMTATSASTVEATGTSSAKSLWKFQQVTAGTFRLVPQAYSGKCLGADANGNLYLADIPSNLADTKLLWYVAVSGDTCTIINEGLGLGLYVSQSANGSNTCLIDTALASSLEQRQWNMLDLVFTAQNVTSNLYLKNLTGKAYEGEDIGVGSYEYTYDKCGFRLKYDIDNSAYRIYPISSCNGQFMALTVKDTANFSGSAIEQRYLNGVDKDNSGSNDLDEEDADMGGILNPARQMFVIEYQTDGSCVFVLKNGSTPNLVLTGGSSGNVVTLTQRSSTLANQKWNLSAYQYEYKNANGVTDQADYAKVECYYRSYGFASPYGANGRSLVITSDFGARNRTTSTHNGLDLRADAETNLYASFSGTVVEVKFYTDAGNVVKIDTGIPAFGNSQYTICIFYAHMYDNSTYVSVSDVVSQGDSIGLSGNTGKSDGPHLHYGIFLHQKGTSSYPASTNAINPLLFFQTDDFDITKTYTD